MTPNQTQVIWHQRYPTCTIVHWVPNFRPFRSTTNILTIKFGWYWMKTGGSSSLLYIRNFAKCTKWPQTKLKESSIIGALPMCTVVPRVPNFHPFRSTISCFQDIAHFRIFPLTPMLKFQSAINRLPIYTITFHSLMTTLFSVKFGSDRMKNGAGVVFWNFCSHRVAC